MTMGGQQGGGLGEMFERATGLPAPDKVMAELQRLNANIEKLAPDLKKIATSIDGLQPSDIRTLSQALQGAKISDATRLLQQIYTRIWGR